MELPAMTPEARAKIEADAREHINAGNAALAQAQNDYHRAMIGNDTAGMVAAMTRQRVALGEMESGTAALRALSEGQPPRQIALAWFREQMNLSPGASSVDGPVRPFGISWFHFISMVVAALFALTVLAFGVARHRRSIALVNQLTKATPVPVPVPVPVQRPPAQPPTPQVTAPPMPRAVVAPGRGWIGSLLVASIVRETPHVKTFRLVDPNGGPVPFTFVPGQFLNFSTDIEGRTIRRSYTIASPPSRNSYVEITVKREDEGEFSRFLHDKLAVGDVLQVSGPAGAFTFDGGTADNIVLIAGGVGITPMMCVIRYLTDTSWPGEVFLVFAMRSTEEFIFREELEYLQRRYPRLHVAATVGSRSEGTAWMGLEGPISRETLAHAVPGIEKRRVHLCGPPPMMEAIRGLLGELGVPPDQIKTEAFGPATGLVPPARPAPPPPPPASVARLLDKVDAAAADVSPQQAVGPATATVSFARSARSAPLPPDKSVLEVAESIGVPIDYSCRVGTCGICKTRLLSGQVTMEVQDALTDEDKANGLILACQAHALHDIAVDA
ncbi:MAG: 2Fe-2S iron-sulfur cluster binding domain-containing protein [Rhodospirillales bacterium]|nr:2Fe-2S iron-sulfur cluster binding domain-containing protein [Rhodospirillales bacterium]